jgi:hypothetical protein
MPYLFRKKRFKDVYDQLSKKKTANNEIEFLLEFDPSLNIPSTWVTLRELVCINILRDDINTISLYRGQGIVLKPNSFNLNLFNPI